MKSYGPSGAWGRSSSSTRGKAAFSVLVALVPAFFLFAALAFSAIPAQAASEDGAASPGAEEYLVYSAVVNDILGEEGPVHVNISDETVPGFLVDGLLAQGPTFAVILLNETLEDLGAKGAGSWPLERRFDLRAGYDLVNEVDDPGATRVLGFSRVGFGGDQALLLVEESAYWYVSEGSFFLLERGEGGWKVVERELAYLGE